MRTREMREKKEMKEIEEKIAQRKKKCGQKFYMIIAYIHET